MPGTTAESDPRLVELDPLEAERWDRFANQHPDATAYHLSAWGEIMKRSYRFEPMYLALEGPGREIMGILPLVYRRGPLSGARVVSLPARIQVAGPLGRSIDEEVVLLGAACEIVRSGKASRLQVRSRREGYEHALPDLAAQRAWPAWRMELPPDPDAFWERFTGHSKSLRRNVRKAQRSGVSVREGSSSGDLRRFYRLYLKTMRKHRELPRSLRQLTVSKRLLGPPGVFKLVVAEYDGMVIAGGVFHFFGDTVELLYNASDDRYLDVRPNHAIYWDVIRMAIAGGFRFFDFGVAQPGSSLAEFKRRWSAEPLARFHYSYPASDAGSGTDRNRLEQASKMRRGLRRRDRTLLRNVWRRAPLALTRLGGVLVYRYL